MGPISTVIVLSYPVVPIEGTETGSYKQMDIIICDHNAVVSGVTGDAESSRWGCVDEKLYERLVGLDVQVLLGVGVVVPW